jgi:hypothetical protein
VQARLGPVVHAAVDAAIQKKLAELFPHGTPSPTQQHMSSSTQQPRSSHFVSCWLQANVDGMMTRVAKGQIFPFTDGTRMMRRVALPLDMMRVQVQEVKLGFESWLLPHPPEEDVTTLG